MSVLQSVPFVAMLTIIAATAVRSIAIRRTTGDRPLAFLSATGAQRVAGLTFAASTIALIVAGGIAARNDTPHLVWCAALIALVGAALVIIAQVQMGRAWRIGVRSGDAPLFVSHGLFRFSRNPIFVGMMLVGLAAAIASGLWWAWAALAIFITSCGVQVRIEEAHLEASFGVAYRDFRATVPRWFGFGGRA